MNSYKCFFIQKVSLHMLKSCEIINQALLFSLGWWHILRYKLFWEFLKKRLLIDHSHLHKGGREKAEKIDSINN